MRWRDEISPAENVRKRLPKRFARYMELGKDSFSKNRTWSELHDFRIATKRMRYTLEIFSPFYGPRYGELIESLRQVQIVLGDLNDLVSGRRLLKGDKAYDDLRSRLEEKSKRKLARVQAAWLERFDEPQAKAWIRYLRTQARARRSG